MTIHMPRNRCSFLGFEFTGAHNFVARTLFANFPHTINLFVLRFEVGPHQDLAYKPNGKKVNPRKHQNRRKQRKRSVLAENLRPLHKFPITQKQTHEG